MQYLRYKSIEKNFNDKFSLRFDFILLITLVKCSFIIIKKFKISFKKLKVHNYYIYFFLTEMSGLITLRHALPPPMYLINVVITC